jgi:hypothetical protein
MGMQNFREIIEDGYVYADKTQYIYNLLTGGKHYFLSRPRRFGKSLLVDTIAEVMSGDRELFGGLFIYDCGYDFKKHPVLRLDMSSIANDTPEILKAELLIALKKQAKAQGLDFDYATPSAMFKTLIEELHIKHSSRVAVLIDEYDKPVLDRLADIESAKANREVLRGFYGILKSMDPHIKITFITGVTKFTKTSVFSELNNLRDITLEADYANICGILIEELDRYFADHIEDLASAGTLGDCRGVRDKILAWYDGYSWDGETRVINPFSLLGFFLRKRFSSFWYESGTPKFLLDVIKKRPQGYTDLRDFEIGEISLSSFDIEKIAAGPLLFQAGYLTIKEAFHHPPPPYYRLAMPNYEVREAFDLHIIDEFTEKKEPFAETACRRIKASLSSGELQDMLETLRALFGSIPYQIHMKHEYYYHSIFYAVMNLLGFDIEAEVLVAGGRIDAVLELDDKVYIVEFKYENCPQNASADEKKKLFGRALGEGMRQITEKGYAKKFAGAGKQIILAAFAFLGGDDIEMKTARL